MSTPTPGVGWIPEDTFAARLLLARRHLSLSVKEAAARCHVHYATWSTWERGATPQNYREIVLLVATGLGVDRDWLAWGGTALATPPGRASVTSDYRRVRATRPTDHGMGWSGIGHTLTGQSGNRLKRPNHHRTVTNLCRSVAA